MNEYKWANKENTSVTKYGGDSIVEGGHGWSKLQTYIADGGQVDPWKTEEELLEAALTGKLQELLAEKNSRVDAVVGTSDPRKKVLFLAQELLSL